MRTTIAFAALVLVAGLAAAPPAITAAPVREYAKVTFRDPVRVADRILMGSYIIEHDDESMPRGGPCTAVYQANRRDRPILTFYCRHLHRPAGTRSTITLRRTADAIGYRYELTEFQFAGRDEAHGVPGIR